MPQHLGLIQKVVPRTQWISICMFASTIFSVVHCTPPEDPIKCSSTNHSTNWDCTITNSYGAFPDRSVCRAAGVAYPKTEQELVSVIAFATKAKRKIKAATQFSHSIPKLVCPDGDGGLLVSTNHLNRVIAIDSSSKTMSVESGVTLREVINEAAKAGLALPNSPYWWGVTIGGLISTGAHGSTLWGEGSSVHDYVVRLRIVTPARSEEGYAKVRVLENSDPDLNAARVSLGVLGVISQVTLRLQPLFKRSITLSMSDDSDLGDQALSFGRLHEFAGMNWYPSQRKVVYRIDDRVSANISGNGLFEYTAFRSTPSVALATVRSTEEIQESTNDANGKCNSAKATLSTVKLTAYGMINNGIIFTGYPVIGYQNMLQSSGTCLDSPEDFLLSVCPWDSRVNGLFFQHTTFSLGLSKVKSFIEDVQKLVQLEPKSMCGLELYDGVLMRYVKASRAYLGKQEDAVDFDFTYYRSKDPLKPRLFEDILEEVEQLAIFKYGGLPHWGKNRNLAFDGVIKKYKKGLEFLKVKEKFDPLGLFSSVWTDQILGLKDGVNMMREGCALEGSCVCSMDIHCAPNMGYFCRPGRVYKDARVCSRVNSMNS